MPEHADGRAPGPRVRVLPPLVFLAVIVLGLAVGYVLPTRVAPPGLAHWVGAVPAAAGLLLGASAAGLFRLAGTTVHPHRASSALVTRGPYRFTRNPMYVGLTLVTLGVGIAAQSLWVLLLLPAALRVIVLWVIRPEEAFLRERFGGAYEAYLARVRRWL